MTSVVDLDPWGGETSRSSNSAFQPQPYTSYTRDSNGGDDAMFRRYQSNWTRFAQPDPYDGSYNLTDPQSFNRYAYVQNDPVNFVDPSGLLTVPLGGFGNTWIVDSLPPEDDPFDDPGYAINPFFRPLGNGGGSGDGGGGGGGGAGPGTNLPQQQPLNGPGQPQPCPPTAAGLLADPLVRGALNQAFTDSQYGTSNAHEEGGWIFMNVYNRNTTIVRVAGGSPNAGMNIPASPPTIAGARAVGFFHTHPYRQGQPAGLLGETWGNQGRASTADITMARSLNMPGLIAYQDRRGTRRNTSFGPNQGPCTKP